MSGGRLNLRGHTVICDGTVEGVVLDGDGAQVLNGAVTGCPVAVLVEGAGNHLVTNVTASVQDSVPDDEEDAEGLRVPFEIVKSTWSARAGHYLIVENVEVKKWPHGTAWGHYHWNGRSAERGHIKAAGTYNWKQHSGEQPPGTTQYSGT